MQAKPVALVTGGMTYSMHNDHVATWLMRERDAGRNFRAYALDIADFDSCAQCARNMLAELGKIDVLELIS